MYKLYWEVIVLSGVLKAEKYNPNRRNMAHVAHLPTPDANELRHDEVVHVEQSPRTQVNSDASQFSHQTGNSTAAAAAYGCQTHSVSAQITTSPCQHAFSSPVLSNSSTPTVR